MNAPIIVQFKIDVPMEKVWKALTDKNEMKFWYFDISDFELEVGKQFNFYEPGEERKYHHQGEILEIIPTQKLKHTWSYPEISDGKTTVIWEIQPDEDATILTLTHENIDNFKDLGENFSRESFIEGWNGIIGQTLKSYLENNS